MEFCAEQVGCRFGQAHCASSQGWQLQQRRCSMCSPAAPGTRRAAGVNPRMLAALEKVFGGQPRAVLLWAVAHSLQQQLAGGLTLCLLASQLQEAWQDVHCMSSCLTTQYDFRLEANCNGRQNALLRC
jgi:hypothetical protein